MKLYELVSSNVTIELEDESLVINIKGVLVEDELDTKHFLTTVFWVNRHNGIGLVLSEDSNGNVQYVFKEE